MANEDLVALPTEVQHTLIHVAFTRGLSFLAAAVSMSEEDIAAAMKGGKVTELVSARLQHWVKERVS